MRVTVVIPVLDDAAELAGCLAALAAQTRSPDEIVVVDNGCRDHSAALAREAGARVVDEPRLGIPAAAATGYDAATGEVIARLDEIGDRVLCVCAVGGRSAQVTAYLRGHGREALNVEGGVHGWAAQGGSIEA